jgi:quercetin dioxygenase-like cupin family protein
MRRFLALVVVLTAAVLVSVVPSSAQEAPISATVLTPRSVFPDDVKLKVWVGDRYVKVDASRTVVVKFVVQPGAEFPWHTHAGPVIVNVKRGTLEYIDDSCNSTAYPAGTAFVDLGADIHSAVNPGSTPTVIVATFFHAPPDPDPLLTPATPPACAA